MATRFFPLLATVASALALSPAAAGPMFLGLGAVGEQGYANTGGHKTIVSADGNTVVGHTAVGPGAAYRYQWGSNITTLGTLPNQPPSAGTRAAGVSADGRVVVGTSAGVGASTRAFRWEEGLGPTELPSLGGVSTQNGYVGEANGVSADGQTVIGTSAWYTGQFAFGSPVINIRAVQWNAAGQVQAVDGPPPPESVSAANSQGIALSADGTRIAGTSYFPNTSPSFGTFYGASGQPGLTQSYVAPGLVVEPGGMSADGSRLFGNTGNGDFWTWTETEGTVLHPGFNPAEQRSIAWMRASTADGMQLGGLVSDGTSRASLFDTQTGGFTDVKQMLMADYGLTELANWSLTEVTGLSADGKVIAGNGFYQPNGIGGAIFVQGWVVDLRDHLVNTGFEVPALNGWRVTGPGVAAAVLDPLNPANVVASLTTGSPVSIEQTTATPGDSFTLAFDYWFRTTTGVLKVLLGDTLLAELFAPTAVAGDWSRYQAFVTDSGLFALSGATLRFEFDGPTGSQVLLDDVALAPAASVVPEPGSLALLATGAVGLAGGWYGRRRRPAMLRPGADRHPGE